MPNYFYSRPYARGDPTVELDVLQVRFISTRAPTRGATFSAVLAAGSLAISTRAPTRGATYAAHGLARTQRDFYSRPYARGNARSPLVCAGGFEFLLTPLREGQPELFAAA